MHLTYIMMLVAVIAAIVLACAWLRQTKTQDTYFANIAEGTHDGNLPRYAAAAIGTRYLFGKVGADADHVIVCGAATDIPIGVITDEAAAAEDPINVALLGSARKTLLVTAGAVIAAGDFLVTDANSKAQPLPAAPATYYIVGRAVRGAAVGELCEFDPIPAVQRVVT